MSRAKQRGAADGIAQAGVIVERARARAGAADRDDLRRVQRVVRGRQVRDAAQLQRAHRPTSAAAQRRGDRHRDASARHRRRAPTPASRAGGTRRAAAGLPYRRRSHPKSSVSAIADASGADRFCMSGARALPICSYGVLLCLGLAVAAAGALRRRAAERARRRRVHRRARLSRPPAVSPARGCLHGWCSASRLGSLAAGFARPGDRVLRRRARRRRRVPGACRRVGLARAVDRSSARCRRFAARPRARAHRLPARRLLLRPPVGRAARDPLPRPAARRPRCCRWAATRCRCTRRSASAAGARSSRCARSRARGGAARACSPMPRATARCASGSSSCAAMRCAACSSAARCRPRRSWRCSCCWAAAGAAARARASERVSQPARASALRQRVHPRSMRTLRASVAVLLRLGIAWRAGAERFEPALLRSPARCASAPAGSRWAATTPTSRSRSSCARRKAAQDRGDDALCRPELFADEQPQHRVFVGALRIDRTEVSQSDYQRCVQAERVRAAARRRHRRAPGAARPTRRPASPGRRPRAIAPGSAGACRPKPSGSAPRAATVRGAFRGAAWNSRVANHGAAGGRRDAHDGYDYAAPVDALPRRPERVRLAQHGGQRVGADRGSLRPRRATRSRAQVDPRADGARRRRSRCAADRGVRPHIRCA